VASALGTGDLFHGATWEFLLPSERPARGRLVVEAEGQLVADDIVALPSDAPSMAQLLDPGGRYGRDGIYGSGPPLATASPEVVAIAGRLPSPMLDFGCGIGALLRALRTVGFDVTGVELDRPDIVDGLQPDVRRFVQLTDGRFPLPFADRSFASAVAFEVLEHVPDVESAARELVRLADEEIAVSVPDPSSIPTLFPHSVVPWHLLEATHLHFFSVEALAGLFAPEFELVEQFRLNRRQVNGTIFYDSLALHLRRATPSP
jgi:SAM-dependent methyltransferase